MLREYPAKQVLGDYLRRWFVDDYFELYVWFDSDNAIYGFQLCYDKEGEERALTWNRDTGLNHHAVDDGNKWVNAAPILIVNGPFRPEQLKPLFSKNSQDLPTAIRELVSRTIEEEIFSPST